MPTIMSSSTTPSNPSGPKIVLTSTPSTAAPQPVPHISKPVASVVIEPVAPPVTPPSPQPVQPSVPESVPQPAPVTPEPMQKSTDMLSVVASAEEDLIKKLAIKHAEETGLITKMKTLISETDEIEESEVALQKKLNELQKLRRGMETDPEKAAELLKASGLDSALRSDVVKEKPTAPVSEKPKAEPTAEPVTKPTAEPTPSVAPVEPIPSIHAPAPVKTPQPLQPISPAQRVLTALQSTFASGDATIAAMLTADAKVERSADKDGVIITSGQGQIHFSNEDLKQAGIAMLELSDIPYAARQNTPLQPITPIATEPLQANPVIETTPVAAPVVTTPVELTEPMKKLITILEKNPPVSIAEVIKNISGIYRSPDGNGVLIMSNDKTVRVSDAELIQSDVSGEDIVDLPTGTAEMMPV